MCGTSDLQVVVLADGAEAGARAVQLTELRGGLVLVALRDEVERHLQKQIDEYMYVYVYVCSMSILPRTGPSIPREGRNTSPGVLGPHCGEPTHRLGTYVCIYIKFYIHLCMYVCMHVCTYWDWR